jgi:hAT family C-terminal dimerisation region
VVYRDLHPPQWKNQISRYILKVFTYLANPLAITAHWIDKDWNLQQTLLDFTEFESPHTGVNMASLIIDTLEFYDLPQKLFCVTTDNATNNDTMARELSDLLFNRHVVLWDYDTQHLYCLAHIINRVVKRLIDTLNSDHQSPFKTTLSKIRDLAKAAQHGSKKPASFRTACREAEVKYLRIPLDIEVRWNSTYRMLEKAIYLRPALVKFIGLHIDDLAQYRLTDNEWAIADQVLMILTPFQRCTARFESNSLRSEVDYVFFAYDTMFNHLEDVQKSLGRSKLPTSVFLRNAIDEALEVLRRYYNKSTTIPFIYSDAMILNPRVKLSVFNLESWSDQEPNLYKNACRKRFSENYLGRSTEPTYGDDITTADFADVTAVDAEYAEHMHKRLKRGIDGESEFDIYMASPNPIEGVKDCLGWWKVNATRFPRLSRMAKDYLAVPPSGCAVEREFSVSGRIATWQRNRLSTDLVAASMIYRSELKRKGVLKAAKSNELDEVLIESDFMCEEEELNGIVPPEWSEDWWKTQVNGSTRR